MLEKIKSDSYKHYHDNGQLALKYTYKNGVEDGPYEEYYKNGQLRIKCTYKNGWKDGPYEEYYENGQLCVKDFWKDHCREGLHEEYHDNGQVKIKCTYKRNRLDGPYEAYYKNGRWRKRAFYKDDIPTRVEVSRAEMRAEMMELQENARNYAMTLAMTTSNRHALAVALNNLRHEFGGNAKKVASCNQTIKALREKAENQR